MSSEYQTNQGNPATEVDATAEQEYRQRPRVYLASLSDYNDGVLHGVWLHVDQEVEELYGAVGSMLQASTQPLAEEWAIHDYEGFGPLRLSEYESLETISRLGLGIAEHGLAFAAWADLIGHDADELGRFQDTYRGHWPSVEAYAEEFLDEVGVTEALETIPAWLRPYMTINTEGFARDLELGGDIQTVEGDGGVWIFEGHL